MYKSMSYYYYYYYHNWMQLWCVDVHNVLSSKNLGYQNPLCYSTGYTTDISKFRFYPWEPIWYYIPSAKAPHDNLKKARWLGFAHTAGDEMTYYIRTEKEPGEGRNTILIRSLITKEEDRNAGRIRGR